MLKLIKVLFHPIYRKIFFQVLLFHPTEIELEKLNLSEQELHLHLTKMTKENLICQSGINSIYIIHPQFQTFIIKFIVSGFMSLSLSFILSLSNRKTKKEYQQYLEQINEL